MRAFLQILKFSLPLKLSSFEFWKKKCDFLSAAVINIQDLLTQALSQKH